MDHDDRRRRLAERLADLGVDAFLVTSLPNVRYLTGFTGSNGQLVLTGAESSVFMTDGRYREQARREVADVPHEIYTDDFDRAFGRVRERLGLGAVAFEAAAVSFRTYSKLGDGLDLIPTTEQVERLRWAKSPDEVGRIAAAQEIADHAFDLLTAKLVEGMTERDVAMELDFAMRQAGCDGLAFDTIVAFGENAAEPHHDPSGRQLGRGDVVKLDFGCVVEGYHSDMTRTVGFGPIDPRLSEVYDVVRRAQQAGIDTVRAGAIAGEVDEAARAVIVEAGYGELYPHSLGHGVGLEIHEGPMLRARSDAVVPERAVVTIEPGVYIPGLGGVRIEDMVEVTGDGCRPLPRTTKDLLIL